jgi:hypothetical protein
MLHEIAIVLQHVEQITQLVFTAIGIGDGPG